MDKKVEVINKFGQTLAIFTSEDEETIDRMIDPVVTLTQNSDNVFSFSISEKSQKWEDIKSVENLYVVDGHVYSPLFADSYNVVKSEDGQNLIQVRAYERQKMLEKVYVTAWNSETGFADIDAFMVVILSKGNLPLKNGNKATGVEAIVDPGEYSLGSAGYIMAGLLYGTGWNVGIVDVEGYFDFETEQLSVYENLLKVQELYGGILIFDSMNKIVHLRQESNYISYTGYEVRYKKNLKDMDLNIDNKIVTRLYVFGEAGLNIASVNDEKIYLENYTYSNEVFEGIESNTDIYEPDQLKAWGERKLLDLCAPRKVLTTNIAYLTQKEGFEQEKLKLNDSVRVYYDEAEFVAPEAGVEIVSTEIEAEGVKAKKESYITLKGNTSQETVEGEDGEEVIDTDIAIINADIEKENYIELQGNTSQATSILPDEYQQVEYITSNAKQYIKTGFAANQDTSIEMKVTTTTLNDNAAFYCSRKTLNNTTFACFRINGQLRHDYGNTQIDTRYTLKVNTPYKIYSNKNKLYVNDSLVHTATYTNFQSPYNMLLLASQDNSQDAGANYWSGNLYYCKIWDNETLVRDFVPCYRKSDNVIGLYDKVEGTFYTNAGTGNFTKGADSVIPNPDYPQEVKVVKGENVVSVQGKNWFNFTNGTYSNHNITATVENGKITLNGTADADSFINIPCTTNYEAEVGDTFSLSINNIATNSNGLVRLNGNGTYDLNFGNANAKRTFTIINDRIPYLDKIVIKSISGTSYNNFVIYPQLERGSTATPYVPYSKTDYPISLGTLELCKIGDYKDYFHKDSGKWYKYKEIGKYTFTGNENWILSQTLTNTIHYYIASIKAVIPDIKIPSSESATDNLISNCFQEKGTLYNVDDVGIDLHVNENLIVGVFPSTASTVANFKTWLASNNVFVYYVLATPTEEEITDETLLTQLEALYTAELAGSTTYISTVADDLEPFIDLKYNVVTQVPSPQKPSEVQVVTGENKFEIVANNLINKSGNFAATTTEISELNTGIRVTIKNAGSYRYAHQKIGGSELLGKTLFLSANMQASSENKPHLALWYGNSTTSAVKSILALTANGTKSITLPDEFPDNCDRINFLAYGNANGTGNAGDYVDYTNLTLSINKPLENYEPYQKTSYTVDLGNLELCDGEYTFKNSIENPHYNPNLELNAWYKHKVMNEIIFNGSESWSRGGTSVAEQYRFAYSKSSTLDILIPETNDGYMLAYCDLFSISTANLTYKQHNGISCTRTGRLDIYYEPLKEYTANEFKAWLSTHNVTLQYTLATPIDEKITDLALTTQLEALYKATLVSPYSHIYSDSGFPIIDLRYNVITPSLYIESNSDLLRVTGVDYPVFNPSSATLTLGDVTLNTNDIFKKISNTTNAYTGGLIPAESVKTVTYDGISKPITQEFETQHALNSTFQYGIDSLNLSVSEVSKLVDENGDDIKTLEEHIGKVEVTAEGLKTTVTNRSGNNLLKNSSALFGEEFWRGTVVQSTATEIQQNFFAKSCFYLQNGTLGQNIAVPNGDYYVGFKYKKLIELANCIVTVNGSPITLEEMEYTTVDKYITVTDNNIDIEIKSDTDNSCYIGDIMVVAGNKEKWSSNPNEIFYDTVEIGKGIQVNSNTANSYTRIDADGNRIYNKASREVVTELTDEGMITNKVYCEQLTAAGVLHQEVLDKYNEEQAWLTKI